MFMRHSFKLVDYDKIDNGDCPICHNQHTCNIVTDLTKYNAGSYKINCNRYKVEMIQLFDIDDDDARKLTRTITRKVSGSGWPYTVVLDFENSEAWICKSSSKNIYDIGGSHFTLPNIKKKNFQCRTGNDDEWFESTDRFFNML